jgi:hypothetical protein
MEAINRKPDNSVGMATALRDVQSRNLCSIPCRRNSFFSSSERPDLLWNLPSLLAPLGAGDVAPLARRPKSAAYHTTLSGVEVKDA